MSDRPDLKVVSIRNRDDIPQQLRKLAHMIESGEIEPLEFLMCVGRGEDGFTPLWLGYGDVPDRHGAAGFFMHLANLALTDAEDYE